jgi:hypothetical protein
MDGRMQKSEKSFAAQSAYYFALESEGRSEHPINTYSHSVYLRIGEHYKISISLRDFILVADNKFYFEYFAPKKYHTEISNNLTRIRTAFDNEKNKIAKYMLACKKARKALPLEDDLKT